MSFDFVHTKSFYVNGFTCTIHLEWVYQLYFKVDFLICVCCVENYMWWMCIAWLVCLLLTNWTSYCHQTDESISEWLSWGVSCHPFCTSYRVASLYHLIFIFTTWMRHVSSVRNTITVEGVCVALLWQSWEMQCEGGVEDVWTTYQSIILSLQ